MPAYSRSGYKAVEEEAGTAARGPEFPFQLEEELAALGATQRTRAVLDLRGVTFMDSAGLKAILRASEFAESHGHTLVLRRGPRQVQRLIELTGVRDRLTFED
jgi:anti-anti-sigma factor